MSQPYETIDLAPGYRAIIEGGVRCFLAEGEEKALLIDTGYGSGDLRGYAESLTFKPLAVINTHSDPDHTGCNHRFAQVFMHPAEFATFARRKGDLSNIFPVWENDVFDLGDRRLEVILIPGHTPGSIALLDRKARCIFTGDPVQEGPIYMFGPDRNVPAYIASIEKLMAIAEDFDIIFPSHHAVSYTPEILPRLHTAARLLQTGTVPGADPGRDIPCKLYDCDGIHFLF